MAKTSKKVAVYQVNWPTVENTKQNQLDRLFTDHVRLLFQNNHRGNPVEMDRLKWFLEKYYKSTVNPFYKSESTPRIKVGHWVTHAIRHGILEEVA